MNMYEKTFNTLRMYESGLQELIAELEKAKVTKRDVDKLQLVVSKLQSAKAHFNDK